MRYFKRYTYYISALFLGCLVSACDPKIEMPTPNKGNADFSKYVSIGNSLTAGFADGGLYREGQLNSYPSLIAQQMKEVGGGDFAQPLFDESQSNGSGYLSLKGFNANGTPQLEIVATNLAIRSISPILYTKYTEPINNYGVPGIRLSDVLTPGYGSTQGNPYLERLLTDAEQLKTYQAKVLESNPTFFTFWLGNNDVLGYATSGGTTAITPMDAFQTLYNNFIDALTANGAKGALATIPNVTLIPLLTTITVPSIRSSAGGAPLYITTGAGAVREATPEDLIPLTTDSIGVPRNFGGNQVPYGFAAFYPLKNSDVLDKDEVVTASAAVSSYNQTITAVANTKGLALMDANALLTRVKSGMVVDGVNLSASYISGGIFSLDGVHLTPRGYAMVANEFIQTINSRYSSTIPLVNVSTYRGVRFP